MKAILFDVDDTLYDLSEPFCKAYVELFGKEEKSLMEKIFISCRKYSDEVYEKTLSGEMAIEKMFIYRIQNALADFEKKISNEDALKFQGIYSKYQFQISLSETMGELLKESGKHWILGVITNGPSKHQWDKINTLGLAKYIPPENIFVSGDLGVAKPQKEIFTYACKRMGAIPDEVCFIGDSFSNDVTGAKNAGLKAVWFHRRNAASSGMVQPDWTVHSEAELKELFEENLFCEN